MSFLYPTHTEIAQGAKQPFNPKAWLKHADGIVSLDKYNLLSIAVITGYLLAIASLTLASITGGFPWFVVMLIVFLPLFALMSGDDQA